jgi:hypothetical protein
MIHFLRIPFDQSPSLQSGVAPIYLALCGFMVFWFISKSEALKAYYFKKYPTDAAWLHFIFMTKWLGFFSMGVLPLLFLLAIEPQRSIAFQCGSHRRTLPNFNSARRFFRKET